MTRQTWTTAEERDWLKSWIPRFLEAQEKKTTSTFWPALYEAWGSTFKAPEPTADDIKAAGSVERAEKTKRSATHKVNIYILFASWKLDKNSQSACFIGFTIILEHLVRLQLSKR